MRVETPVAISVWQCRCGLEFRAARYGDGWVFWPATGLGAYSHAELAHASPCPRCERPIGVERRNDV